MRISKNIWVTHGVHLVVDPALNQEDDLIAIPQLKIRIAYKNFMFAGQP